MFKQNVGSILLVSLATAWLPGCAKTDEDCDCTYNDPLPLPTKIERRGGGLEPVRYFFALDLSTGEAEYERREGVSFEVTCQGTLTLADELTTIKEALALEACTRVFKDPISDGFSDSLILYYPASEVLPEVLKTSTSEDWVTVELREKFVNFVEGRQQFDCRGQFAIDSFINTKTQCLGLE